MISDLLINIAASVIYDFSKAITTTAAKTETIKSVTKSLGIDQSKNDFEQRYIEALVDFKFESRDKKGLKAVMSFFREESIANLFHQYFYGKAEVQYNDKIFKEGIKHCVEALKVGDEVKRFKIDVDEEISVFWNLFKEAVNKSKSVKEVDDTQRLKRIEDKVDGIARHNSTKITHSLTSPPFLSEVFIGREQDLLEIHTRLFEKKDQFLLLVNGEGGKGKTTLAARYFHNYKDQYAHVAWVLSEKSIANALLLLARPLGLEFDEKANTEERLELLLSAMTDLDAPCLLVLDNANDLPDLEAQYQRLRKCSNFRLLLTTRITEFSKAPSYTINGLPEAEALELFEGYYRKLNDAEKTLFLQIREAVNANTLVLELLAKNLKTFDNGLKVSYSLARLLADLQEKGLLKLSQSGQVQTDYQSHGSMRREKPGDIIAAMYDLSGLSREEIALLSVFAVLPAELIPFEMLESLLPETKELDMQVLGLVQKGWLEFNKEEKSIKCSPVVQEVVRYKNEELRGDCDTLVKTLTRELEYHPNTGHFLNRSYEQASVFTRYAETLLSSFKEADRLLNILNNRVGKYYENVGDFYKALKAYEGHQAVCESLAINDSGNPDLKNDLAISYQFLGEIYLSIGNLNKSLAYQEGFNKLEKQLSEAFPQNQGLKHCLAISYCKLGDTHCLLGNLDQALIHYEDFSRMEKELHEAFPDYMDFKDALAISYQNLGTVYGSLGDVNMALAYFVDYNRLEKELYQSFPQNMDFKSKLATSYSKLGGTYSALGNLDKALVYYEKNTNLKKELCEAAPENLDFKNSMAISYSRLGAVQSAMGNLDEALAYFEDSSALKKELCEASPQNVRFKTGLATSYEMLGAIQSDLGNLDRALAYFEDCTTLQKELHEVFPQQAGIKNSLAISYEKLGNTHSALGDLNKALAYYEDYSKLEKELHETFPQLIEFQNNVAVSCSKLGETHCALGNLHQALVYYEDHNRLAKKLYKTFTQQIDSKSTLAVSCLNLGDFHAKKNKNISKAKEYYQQAKTLFESLVAQSPASAEYKKNLKLVNKYLESLNSE